MKRDRVLWREGRILRPIWPGSIPSVARGKNRFGTQLQSLRLLLKKPTWFCPSIQLRRAWLVSFDPIFP